MVKDSSNTLKVECIFLSATSTAPWDNRQERFNCAAMAITPNNPPAGIDDYLPLTICGKEAREPIVMNTEECREIDSFLSWMSEQVSNGDYCLNVFFLPPSR
ncbi:hypothetical protein B0O80DRAFT_431883 [Mortierella sp. GBAus27b]|nr:hypothetical protein B0O80DRAFT_431883 [Mortierella sp. GBAus27b]